MARVGVGLAMILTACAPPALAQTTSCEWELGKWVCRESRGPIMPQGGLRDYQRAYDQSYAAAQRAREDREARRRKLQSQESQQQVAAPPRPGGKFDARKHDLEVMELIERYIAIGRCKEAAQLAYDELGSTDGRETQERCEAK